MVLKGQVHIDKIRSNGLERSQLENAKIRLYGLKGVNWVYIDKSWVHNVKIRSCGLERSQLGTH